VPGPWGVTPQGFNAKPLAEVEAEVDADLKTVLGESAGTEPDGTIPLRSPAGQIKTLVVDVSAEQWDGQQAIYASFDPDKATGASQDAVNAITGTVREPAAFSTVTATCCGTPGTVLPAKRVASVQVTNRRFASPASATIAALTAWATSTNYVLGDRRTANGRCYVNVQAGQSSGVGSGPSGSTFGVDIVDNTAKWRYIGTGTGAVDVPLVAEVAGPFGATALQLTNIATPVAGWSTVVNLADATPGRTVEADGAFRVRRAEEIALSGNATANAIRAEILAVNASSTDPAHLPVKSCTVFYNDTDFVDADGVPPHSVEVLAFYDGLNSATTDQDIANAVFDAVAAGIRMYGNQSATVIDSEGNPQAVGWSKPTPIDVWVSATVRYDASKWAPGSDAAVADSAVSAVVNHGDGYPVRLDVYASALVGAIFGAPAGLDGTGAPLVPVPETNPPTPGVINVSALTVGTAPGPVGSSVTIGTRERAAFSTSRCVFTASPVTL